MKIAAFLVAAVVAMLFAVVQPGAAAVLGCPKAGTVIKTSTGGSLQFKAREGDYCPYTGAKGDISRVVLGIVPESWKTAAEALEELPQLDLNKPGSEVKLTKDGKGDCAVCVWWNVYTVLPRQTITIPAGTYEVVPIRWHEQSGTGGYEAEAVIYYAPSVGYRVKFVIETKRGNPSSARNWEAVEIRLP